MAPCMGGATPRSRGIRTTRRGRTWGQCWWQQGRMAWWSRRQREWVACDNMPGVANACRGRSNGTEDRGRVYGDVWGAAALRAAKRTLCSDKRDTTLVWHCVYEIQEDAAWGHVYELIQCSMPGFVKANGQELAAYDDGDSMAFVVVSE
ncbi:hypothetical protein K439DRAFT_1509146 [Ramaria rubella]|nr:hypothetical protein K439DRAFT_1509146 [Ramaria rubella]